MSVVLSATWAALRLSHPARSASRAVQARNEIGPEADVLVNNAGFGTHGRFAEIDAAREAEEVRLNCEALITLTHAFLPGMLERRQGGVITVASTAGMQPLPYEATYRASKAFARTFSDALHAELRGTGVRVLSVNPGPVPTEWQQVAGYAPHYLPPVPGKITAAQVAKESLRAFERGERSIIPGRWSAGTCGSTRRLRCRSSCAWSSACTDHLAASAPDAVRARRLRLGRWSLTPGRSRRDRVVGVGSSRSSVRTVSIASVVAPASVAMR